MKFQQLRLQKTATLSVIILSIIKKYPWSIPGCNSHHLDQMEINDRSMYFPQATETEIVESIMQMK